MGPNRLGLLAGSPIRPRPVNALRGHLADFGLVAAQGARGLAELVGQVLEDSATDNDAIRPLARRALASSLQRQLPPR